jgi:phage-related protein (TIGR01555 family)
LIGADDGQEDLSKPLNEDAVTTIRHLTAFTGGWDGELVAWSYYRDPTQPKYGRPEIYMLRNVGVPASAGMGVGEAAKSAPNRSITWVHESRLIVFSGPAVSRESRIQMRGWGDPVFTRIDQVLSHYDQTWGGVANLMTDFSQGVLKVGGLLESMGGNNKNPTRNLSARALALNMSRSISRVMLVDADKEDFKRDILQQFALRLAAAADMPVALLMGQAPAGLNATGASDIRFFYDRVAAKQRNRLLPQLNRLVRLVFKSKEGPTAGTEPDKWNITFRSLYQLSELEKATLRKTVAETDAIYISNQVLTPEEVAASTFGGSEWSMERTIDMQAREEMADQDARDKEAMAKAMLEAAKNPAPAPAEEMPEPPADPKEAA